MAIVPATILRLAGSGRAIEIAAGVIFLLSYAGAWRVLGAEPIDREIWRSLRRARSSRDLHE